MRCDGENYGACDIGESIPLSSMKRALFDHQRIHRADGDLARGCAV